MDGQLYVVDHTGIIVSCFLPNCLLPGPLVYIARIDCLATVSSGRQLEVFRYLNLCAASTATDGGTAHKSTSGRRLMVCLASCPTSFTVPLVPHSQSGP